jgi:hypothetical protein
MSDDEVSASVESLRSGAHSSEPARSWVAPTALQTTRAAVGRVWMAAEGMLSLAQCLVGKCEESERQIAKLRAARDALAR